MYNGTSQAPTSRLLDTGKAISLQAAHFPFSQLREIPVTRLFLLAAFRSRFSKCSGYRYVYFFNRAMRRGIDRLWSFAPCCSLSSEALAALYSEDVEL